MNPELALFFIWCSAAVDQNRIAKAAYMRGYNARNHEKKRAANAKGYSLHKEARLASGRAWSKKNRARSNKIKRDWAAANRESDRASKKRYRDKQMETNPTFKMLARLRVIILQALRRKVCKKTCRTSELLGIPASGVRTYLEGLFQPGMSWDNYGQWHIDHIRPCASFDLTDPAQQRMCFNYKNLQPLWAADNLRKGANCPT